MTLKFVAVRWELTCLLALRTHRDEINSLRVEKPNPNERRTVVGSKLATSNDSNVQFEEEKKIEESASASAEKEDDDSDVIVGEIAGDRLDTDDNADDEDDSEIDGKSDDAVSLFHKLLSISQEKKKVKPAVSESSEPESITASKMLNGRQVSYVDECSLVDKRTNLIPRIQLKTGMQLARPPHTRRMHSRMRCHRWRHSYRRKCRRFTCCLMQRGWSYESHEF